MKDFGISVLEQYEIDIKETRRVRGGVLVEAEQGKFLLKEVKIVPERMEFLVQLYGQLNENGFELTDTPMQNKEGAYLSKAEDESCYVLKKWFLGRECDIKKEIEVIEGAKTLAEIHRKMKICVGDEEKKKQEIKRTLQEEYERHNRELRKIYTFVQKRRVKNEFEAEFLCGYEKMYYQAQAALDKMKEPEYIQVCENARKNHEISHGDYNYHNILFCQQGVAITGFEHAHWEIQLSDLYYYLRKILEKYHYDERIGCRILKAYDSVISLGKNQRDYLAIRLSYPEKFWKIANAYYCSNKAWIPQKNVDKLKLAIAQAKEKELFLERVFAFRL